MDNSKIKSDVLQQLIDMMDEKMVGDLRSKNPKIQKPEMSEPEALQEDKFEDPSKESDMSDLKMDMAEGEDPLKEQSDESPEDKADMERLLAMYSKLK